MKMEEEFFGHNLASYERFVDACDGYFTELY